MVSYFQVLERLDEIMQDLVARQAGHEHAAEELARTQRDVKKRLAQIRLKVKFGDGEKDTVQAREDKALLALAAAGDGLYARWIEAEAMYAGSKAAFESMSEAATIGMSLLKAMQREGESSDPRKQPAWSANGSQN